MAAVLADDLLDRIRSLRYDDGYSIPVTARMLGVSEGTVKRCAPGRPGKVDNRALREAFLASGLDAVVVARRLEWTRGDSLAADGSRVRRALGLKWEVSRGSRTYRRWLDAETAEKVAHAIGVAPWEVM